MRRRSWLELALVGGIAGGAARGARAQDLTAIRLGNINSISDAPIFIADRKGYFRDAGLRIDYQTFDSAASMVAPLGAGQLDVAAGGTSAGLFNAVARGIDMRVVADKASDPRGYGFAPLLVRTELIRSGRYKTLKDLKGMTVAISAPGSSSWPELGAIADKAGLKFDDIGHVALDYPDHVVGYKNGSIDASVTIEPFATAAVQTGAATKIMGDDEYYLDQEVAVLIYGGPFMRTRRALAERFMTAYIKGARYYNDALANGRLAGPTADDVIAILTQTTPIKNAAVFRAITPNGVNPDGRVNVASMQRDLEFYRGLGLIQGKTIRASDTVDQSFALAAVKELGPYRPVRR